jgi:plasmid maintenance system antidote protein VapI
MFAKLPILKGLHPGFFLERELRNRGLKKGPFALSIGEYPQTFGAVLLGKRNMNPLLAMKVEEKLELEEGFLMCLQALYEMKQSRNKIKSPTPELSRFRPVLFWDTDIHKINWQKNKRSIIKRVLARGNEQEKKEIERFYNIPLNHFQLG